MLKYFLQSGLCIITTPALTSDGIQDVMWATEFDNSFAKGQHIQKTNRKSYFPFYLTERESEDFHVLKMKKMECFRCLRRNVPEHNYCAGDFHCTNKVLLR